MSLSNDILEQLILEGVVEIAGMSESGEFMYSFTPKLAEAQPELHAEVTSYFYSGLLSLCEKGFLDIDLSLEEPLVYLIGEAVTPEAIDALPSHEKLLLENLIRQFNNG